MSFNRLSYDNCAYSHQLSESVGTLAYILDPLKYEHCNKCRIEKGIVGGTDVSHVSGNLVDLESDLRGITRQQSKCPTMKYQNPCPKSSINSCQQGNIVVKGNPIHKGFVINTTPKHLSPCQMFRYKPTLLPTPMKQYQCL